MLNLDYLKSISGGDDAFTKEMLTIFQSEIPKNLAIIRQRFDTSDFQGLRDIIHKYKASLLTLGMTDTVERVKKIEEECLGSKNLEIIKSNLEPLLSESETTLEEINQWVTDKS
jgi:HPt (histidine-containing phosphotransfer) domain-containing protein